MAVSLSDHYVLLLQNVVEENYLLREQLQKSTQETRSCIEEMKSKIDNMSAGAGRRIRQTGPVRAIRVPKLCRVSVYIFMYILLGVYILHFSLKEGDCRTSHIVKY